MMPESFARRDGACIAYSNCAVLLRRARMRASWLFGLLTICMFASTPFVRAQEPQTTKPPEPAKLVVWNREIVVLRTLLFGLEPATRVEQATERINALPVEPDPQVVIQPVTTGGMSGDMLLVDGRLALTLLPGDVDPESGKSLEQLAEETATRRREVLAARLEQQQVPAMLRGIGLALLATMLAAAAFIVWARIARRALDRMTGKLGFVKALHVGGIDLRPTIETARLAFVRLTSLVLGVIVLYVWLTFVLAQFPYSRPWSAHLGAFLLETLVNIGRSIVGAISGLFMVFLIYLIARAVVRMLKGFFVSVEAGRLRVRWLEPETARATRRIVSVVVWAFALTLAYPYIPGSDTPAFKGVSVLIGLMATLGSAGFVTQLMSGLVVIYARSLRLGEYVQVGDNEGIVTEVGLLSTTFATMRNEELTIPNGLLISHATQNLSRLTGESGVPLWTSVTIGYDTPWRQLHELLISAASATENVRKDPGPSVIQDELSDYYVHYTLQVRLENPKMRRTTLSDLNSKIQDSFNAARVQTMSPHYRARATEPVLGPPGPEAPTN